MIKLTADQVETAFVETVREQVNGEPFNWQRAADHLNHRLHVTLHDRVRALPFLLGGEPKEDGR